MPVKKKATPRSATARKAPRSGSPTKTAKKAVTEKGTKKVMVGRFGEEPTYLKVGRSATVKDVLEQAEMKVTARERVWLNGSRAKLSDKVSANDAVSVIAPKQAS